MNETMLQARLCERVVPVGSGAQALLAKMQKTRIPGDPVFAGQVPSPGDRGTLCLALDDSAMEALRMKGIPCACVLPEEGTAPDFAGAKILVSAPWDIDAGDFERIYRRLYHLPWMIGETPRLILREMMLSDLAGLYALYDAEAKRYLPHLARDPEEERTILRAYLENVYGLMGYGYWAVIEKRTGELVGRAGFGVPAHAGDPPELGYLIRKDRRGLGYAKEAAQGAIDYGRRVLHFPGMTAQTEAENLPSRRVLVSLGFREEPRKEDGICRYAL